jgi:hypothetical protein
VQRSQVALMQQSFPDVKVVMVGEHEAMTPFDYWAALWSLPAALGITLANLPAPSRFLQLVRKTWPAGANGWPQSRPKVKRGQAPRLTRPFVVSR